MEMPYAPYRQARLHNVTQHDRPSIFLWLGALTLPFVFGWYLLDWRFNSWTRIFGFSWSVFATGALLISMILHPPPKSEVQAKQETPPVQSTAITDEPTQTYDMNQIDIERRQNCLQHPNSLGHWFMCSDVPEQPQTVIVIVPPAND
jgi:hypothetical protein